MPASGVQGPDMPGSDVQTTDMPGSGSEAVGAEGAPVVAGLDTGGDDEGAGSDPPADEEGTPPEDTTGDEPPPVDEPAVDEPAVDEPAVDEPTVDEPTVDEPTVDEPVVRPQGPCDIYAAANAPCVAAYSMVRALSSTYQGPLYQVRRGAPNPFQNTGTGGQRQDVGLLPNGFADAAAQQAFCGNQSCTVSMLYDQSGRGNDITVAKRGRSDGGQFAAADDFESNAASGPLTVDGNDVYSLFMEARQGYRQTMPGNGMPRGQAAQGIYMLADGTRTGTACCWDFGNVTTNPTEYHTMNTLFFGQGFWGRGAGAAPWFLADFEGGVWAGGNGGSNATNQNNPSMRVRFALGFLKTNNNDYALRMADVASATNVTTAYEGPLPKPMDNQGAVVLGVGGDNSNNSFGTFFEGAIVAGYPAANVELDVMRNIQAAGYGR